MGKKRRHFRSGPVGQCSDSQESSAIEDERREPGCEVKRLEKHRGFAEVIAAPANSGEA